MERPGPHFAFLEGNNSFNALNFNVDYNEATGMNFTGASTVVASYLCPSSASRQPDGGMTASIPTIRSRHFSVKATVTTTTAQPVTPTSTPTEIAAIPGVYLADAVPKQERRVPMAC